VRESERERKREIQAREGWKGSLQGRRYWLEGRIEPKKAEAMEGERQVKQQAIKKALFQ